VSELRSCVKVSVSGTSRSFITLCLHALVVYIQKSDFHLITVFHVVIVVKNVLCLVCSYFVIDLVDFGAQTEKGCPPLL